MPPPPRFPPRPPLVGGKRPLGRQAQRLRDLLQRLPGLNIDELSAHLDLRRTAINHHLRILIRLGDVVRVRRGRHALHFRADTPMQERVALSLLRVPGVLAVSLDAFDHPQGESSARAVRLGMSTRHVRRVLRLLERNGMARTDQRRRGEPTVVHLHAQLRLVLAHLPAADEPDDGAVTHGPS